ncbi:hypothetical protein C0584_01665 [Candidatus Parcubacteria bacterium]|nr:MAG: hypothetical protein C0584_01665 [Candidatus Parcubacteria bacterium]
MSDQYKEVVSRGLGSRLMNSIKGILIGLLLFVVSFIVLYVNEGRVDLSKVAEEAIQIDLSEEVQLGLDGLLISSTGELKSDEKIGDTYLVEGDYLLIKRVVEMYAWEEESHSETEKNIGGSETTETTYTYTTKWTSSPKSSSRFKIEEGHTNPKLKIDSKTITTKKAMLGLYELDTASVSLPQPFSLDLTEDKVIEKDSFRLVGDYLYQGNGTLGNPAVGDLRISYLGLENPMERATIFGSINVSQKSIEAHRDKKAKLFRVFDGSREEAITKMATEHSTMTWILRLVGFFMMWFGLMALFGPISVVLDILPTFGSISRFSIGLVSFFASLVLSGVTIIVSKIAHNPVALFMVVLIFVVIMLSYLKTKRKKGYVDKDGGSILNNI